MKPMNILIVNYACYKLWPWIANSIKGSTRQENNPYYSWITDNEDDSSAKKLEGIIDTYSSEFDFDEVYKIVVLMVQHEIDFFAAACQK